MVDPQGERGQKLGYALDISDRFLIAGAPAAYANPSDGSQALIYEKSEGVWSFSDRLHSGHVDSDERFGQSIAIDGYRVLIGAPESSLFSNRSGAVFLFEHQGGEWVKTAEIGTTDITQPAWFGAAVALDGDWIVVGAPLESAPQSYAGAAYLFKNVSGDWERISRLSDPSPGSYGYFGHDIAMSDQFIAIGAPGHSTNGGCFLYEKIGDSWVFHAFIDSPDSGYDANFGFSVAIEGNRLVVSAPKADMNGVYNQGCIYIFEYDGAGFNLDSRIVPEEPSAYSEVGRCVAISGDRLVASSPFYRAVDVSVGMGFVFERTGEEWIETAHLLPHDGERGDKFSYSVAISDTEIMCGSPEKDTLQFGMDSGGVYLFDLLSDATPVPTFTQIPVSPTPTAVPTGDVWSNHTVCVYEADTEPRLSISGATIEARYYQYGSFDECSTGSNGCCSISLYCHDTHYVSVSVSAPGYHPGSSSYICYSYDNLDVELVPLMTRTPTPSAPPSPEPTSLFTPTPCCGIELDLILPDIAFNQGEVFFMDAMIQNYEQQTITDVPLFVILDIQGSYWFWPSWKAGSEGIDYLRIDCPVEGLVMSIIDPFAWPAVNLPMDLRFWGAVLDATFSHPISNIEMIALGWE